MAITFPSSPSPGDIFTSNGKSWQYVNGKWESYGETVAPDVFAVDAANDVVNVYGSLSAGASASVGTDLEVSGDLTVDTDTLHVDSTNNRVGIGTTAPSYPLEVDGSVLVEEGTLRINRASETAAASAGNIIFQVNGSNWATIQQDSAGLLRIASSTVWLDGSVGIGTSTPATAFDISGSSTSQFIGQRIVNTNSTAGAEALLKFEVLDQEGHIGLERPEADVGADMFFATTDAGASDPFAPTERMRISQSGNVGIGTASPATLLHVSSGTSGDAELRISADTDNNVEDDLPYLSLTADGGIIEGVVGLNDNTLVLANSVSSSRGIDFRIGTSNYYNTAAEMVANTTSIMFVASSGGVTTPFQPRFEVTRSGTGFTSGQYVPYNVVESDSTGSYSTSTYRYTVPVTGTYFFYWTNIGQANSGTVHRYYFRVNGADYLVESQLRLDQTGENASKYTQASQQRIVDLSAGDYVQIYYQADNGGASYGNVAYTRFGGYMLG